MRPRILDLFCCAGGAAKGYHDAGFDPHGVDWLPQPRYPYPFRQADCVQMLLEERVAIRRDFDAVHASPPCQGYTAMRHAPGAIGAPRLIPAVVELLTVLGLPWILENVPEAVSDMPRAITLCGTMFGLEAHGCELHRHRLFIASFPIQAPEEHEHSGGPVVGVYGDHARVRSKRHGGRGTRDVWPETHREVMNRALGTGWMSAHEASEAIPPAYTEWLGKQLLSAL